MASLAIPIDSLIFSPGTNQSSDFDSRADVLNAVYKQLFKENRDLFFFHNQSWDSAFLKGKLSTRELVCRLLSSEMYRDYILLVNSNYHFVALCFERVLGRPASKSEVMTWSSLLAVEGLDAFARALTSSEEYLTVFGDDGVPARRSTKLASSNQGLPALPKEQSQKRYTGYGWEAQLYGGSGGSRYPWQRSMPPVLLQRVGAVFAIIGVLEVTRVFLTIAAAAFQSGL